MSKWTKEELNNMLEDVVNELDLSEIMVEKHGQLGTAPAELVKLVLREKDLKIRMLEANFVDANVNSELPIRKVCFFSLKDNKYMTENGIEITTEMLVKYPHQITETWSFIVLD